MLYCSESESKGRIGNADGIRGNPVSPAPSSTGPLPCRGAAMSVFDWLRRRFGYRPDPPIGPAVPIGTKDADKCDVAMRVDMGFAGGIDILESCGITTLVVHTDSDGKPMLLMGSRVLPTALRALAQWADQTLAGMPQPRPQ